VPAYGEPNRSSLCVADKKHVPVAWDSSGTISAMLCHLCRVSVAPQSFPVFAFQQLNYKYYLAMVTMKQSILLMDNILSGSIHA